MSCPCTPNKHKTFLYCVSFRRTIVSMALIGQISALHQTEREIDLLTGKKMCSCVPLQHYLHENLFYMRFRLYFKCYFPLFAAFRSFLRENERSGKWQHRQMNFVLPQRENERSGKWQHNLTFNIFDIWDLTT